MDDFAIEYTITKAAGTPEAVSGGTRMFAAKAMNNSMMMDMMMCGMMMVMCRMFEYAKIECSCDNGFCEQV